MIWERPTMPSLAELNVRRVTGNRSIAGPNTLLVTDAETPAPDGSNVYRLSGPGSMSCLVSALYGNHISALSILDCDWDLDSMPDWVRTEAVNAFSSVVQQWGNSTIDSAHGLANLIANVRTLIPSPKITKPITDAPIIAVGAGPSTQELLPQIAESGCPVICCDAALKPLLAHGVKVLGCTPLERLRSTAWKLPEDTGNAVFMGSPFCPPEAVRAFASHTFWPTADPIYEWLGIEGETFHPGTTTGTMAVAVALRLTTGPVYLVGHDLCGGHMDGADISKHFTDGFNASHLGHDGEMKKTKTAWLRAKFDLEGMDTKRLINAGGNVKMGLVLDGIRTGPLPIWVDSRATVPTSANKPLSPEILERITSLPDDLLAGVENLTKITALSECGLDNLIHPRSLDAAIYLLRPLYAQMSIERRFGHEPTRLVSAFQEAFRNIVTTVVEPLRHACQ